jgi:hypothetical protein
MNINIEINLLKESLAKLQRRVDAMSDELRKMGKSQSATKKAAADKDKPE